MIQCILLGVQAFHTVDQIHKDITISNIYLDGYVAKLGPIGRAPEASESLHDKMSLISPPETFYEKGPSFASDMWSVGIVIY